MVVNSLALVFRILFAVAVLFQLVNIKTLISKILKLHDYNYRSFSRNFCLGGFFFFLIKLQGFI